MLCQLMMGFYALVEDGHIKVDGSELEGWFCIVRSFVETASPVFQHFLCRLIYAKCYDGLNADARWFTREEVLNAVAHDKYKREKQGTMTKIALSCSTLSSSNSEKGERRGRRGDGNELVGDVASIFVPGPYAIAHNLITSWLSGPPLHVSSL